MRFATWNWLLCTCEEIVTFVTVVNVECECWHVLKSRNDISSQQKQSNYQIENLKHSFKIIKVLRIQKFRRRFIGLTCTSICVAKCWKDYFSVQVFHLTHIQIWDRGAIKVLWAPLYDTSKRFRVALFSHLEKYFAGRESRSECV